MEESTAGGFLSNWHSAMIIGAIAFTALAIIIYIYHNIRVSGISDYKDKYDYLRKYEIKAYKLCFILIAVAVAMLINTYGKNTLEFDPVWFFVRLFISVAGGTLIGYIAALVLQYYYPTKLNKKLRKWRYTPRVNPNTGRKMRLLSEDEEDVHLDEGMQAEENVFSVDYDVWIDEETGYTKIEKYQGHLEALQCGNCGFYTMKVVREEIIEPPTETKEGELIKHYECQYCGSVRATQFHIAREENYDGFKPEQSKFKKNALVNVVKVEIHGSNGEKKSYTFQTVEQATKFLDEFDFEKTGAI
ncbi:hypothetical protein [Fulvivirga imtechensis]|nr:hypothetical protein [Fulvivirga imtechensis]